MKNKLLGNFLYGIGLGLALLAPGLSIATLAMILGIYEDLLQCISDFFSSRYKKALQMLLPMGVGGAIGVLISSQAISWAYDHFTIPTYSFFLGLIAASIPLLLKASSARTNFGKKQVALLVAIALLIGSLRFLNPVASDHEIQALDIASMIRLFFTGALTSTGMLLPGISGALILMLMGTHSMLTHAVSDFNLPILGITAFGALAGIILSSKALRYVLKNHAIATNAVSIGMVVGSIFVIIPAYRWDLAELLGSLVSFVIGYAIVALLEKSKKKRRHHHGLPTQN
ncbi:MAG: DUF368 domain-containing protein [Turicibacter sp.]|nr:DUF368 domain-containing protein [Turicibacter sp.]